MKNSPTRKQATEMLSYILADRTSNYGYDWKAFRRIVRQRSNARKALASWQDCPETLNWNEADPSGRIDWQKMHYVVGQSSNEEITNLLRRLVNPEAAWLS